MFGYWDFTHLSSLWAIGLWGGLRNLPLLMIVSVNQQKYKNAVGFL